MRNKFKSIITVYISIVLSILFIYTYQARADFIGKLVLEPKGCQEIGICTLGEDFGFIDREGTGWQAAKGLLSDGASIPPWAQLFIGKPFEKAYIKAAIIHDHYCDRHVRAWRQTHKVFHEALLKSAVDPIKAGIMYFGVMVGGPKWIKLVRGKPCPVGMGCINQFDVSASIHSSNITVGSKGSLLMVRQELYSSASFANLMQANIPQIEALGDSVTAEQIEKIARKAMKQDFYFVNGNEVGTGLTATFSTK